MDNVKHYLLAAADRKPIHIVSAIDKNIVGQYAVAYMSVEHDINRGYVLGLPSVAERNGYPDLKVTFYGPASRQMRLPKTMSQAGLNGETYIGISSLGQTYTLWNMTPTAQEAQDMLIAILIQLGISVACEGEGKQISFSVHEIAQ